MNKQMKKELINDVLTGLLVSAAFAAVIPLDALAAGDFSAAASSAKSTIGAPFVTVISLVSYGLGTVMTVAGIAGAKKHADNPTQSPLTPALGKLGAGAAFLAAPAVVSMVQNTGSATMGSGSATFATIGGF